MAFNPLGNLKIPVNVIPTHLPDPTPIRGNTYRAWRGTVFTCMPSASDVKQGDIGNCYLVASLQAILARHDGPSVIQELVRDEGDSVVMKMHKDGTWHYVRVNKTLPGKFFSDRDHSLGAKWVQLFEKAYAAFIKGGSYQTMARGGDNLAAIPVFLGSGSQINQGPENSLTALHLLTDQPSCKTHEFEAIKAKLYGGLHKGIGLNESEAAEWYAWIDRSGLSSESFKNCYIPPYTSRFDQIVERFSNGLHALSMPLKIRILEWYKRETPIPGAVGSGVYTPGQLNFFMRIQRAIGAQRSVSVESKNSNLWPAAATSRKGTGERKLDGLASDHAYSVVDTKSEANLRYLLIRNPWGTYQRVYVTGPGGTLKAKARTNSGDSWIELADFFLYFQAGFTEGAPVHNAARAGLMTDLQDQLQREIAKRTLRFWGGGL